jgi:hypothetical protein
MSGNNIERLREHLFAELEDVRNPDKKYDKDRTRAVVEIAQTLINSVKAETNFFNAVGQGRRASGFIPEPVRPAAPALPAGAARKQDEDLPADAGWMK